MDLVNRSEAEAQIFYTVAGEDRLLAAVVVRRTFRIEGDALVPDAKEPFPVAEREIETEYGTFEPETPFAREGFELFVLGKVYPEPAPAPRAQVEIEVGSEFRRIIVAYGDRTWVRQQGGLRPSSPLPFESLPLTASFAYGGKAQTEVGEFAHPGNPAGRGFYLSEEAAEGALLPNLEWPESSVQTWQDQPTPVAVTPLPRESSLRLERGIDYDTASKPPSIRKIKPAYFNSAHPTMLLERAPDGHDDTSAWSTPAWARAAAARTAGFLPRLRAAGGALLCLSGSARVLHRARGGRARRVRAPLLFPISDGAAGAPRRAALRGRSARGRAAGLPHRLGGVRRRTRGRAWLTSRALEPSFAGARRASTSSVS